MHGCIFVLSCAKIELQEIISAHVHKHFFSCGALLFSRANYTV